MRVEQILSIVAVGALITGCMPTYYAGIRGANGPPIVAAPSLNGQMYRYLSFDAGNGTVFNDSEYNHYARARYLWALSNRHSDTNLGIAVYQGRYSAIHTGDFNGVNGYYGLAPSLSHALHISKGRVDLGLGVHAVLALEGGDFLTFRRKTENANLAENDTTVASVLLALYPMLRYRPDDVSNVTLQVAVGTMGPLSPSLMYQRNRSFLWLYWMPNYLSGNTRHGFGSFALGIGRRL